MSDALVAPPNRDQRSAVSNLLLFLRPRGFRVEAGLFLRQQQALTGWLMIARLHNARRDVASAEGALEKALRSVPNDARLHRSMADARMLAGKPRKALEASLERAAKLSPDDPAVLADLGALLSNQGEHDRAVPVLEKAGALGASSLELLYALANIRIAVGQREAAELTILKLQLLYPDGPQTQEANKLQ